MAGAEVVKLEEELKVIQQSIEEVHREYVGEVEEVNKLREELQMMTEKYRYW